MSEKVKKKKILWQQYIGMVFFVLIGAVCGFFMARYIGWGSGADKALPEKILSLIGLFLGMYVAIFVQLIIHEAGHLVFGLLSGYAFGSFRIFSFMWVKEGEKIRLRRLSIAGTGGQCLMTPPDMVDGRIPVILYNLGGSLMNVMAGLVFLGLYFVFASAALLPDIMLLFAVVGFILAVMNGVPMRMGMVDNDGYNALSLTRSREAMRSFWMQMKVNEQIAKGVRMKDMPDEWFAIPSDEAMKNSMAAVTGVFACSRLMDAQRFEEAEKLMRHMLEIDSGMVGLHRNLLLCDCIYAALITGNRRDVLDVMRTKEQKKFMKQMKNFPSVIRTEYAYALLCERDLAKADKFKEQFEKCAKTYPYPNDVQSERNLMELAAEKMKAETAHAEGF